MGRPERSGFVMVLNLSRLPSPFARPEIDKRLTGQRSAFRDGGVAGHGHGAGLCDHPGGGSGFRRVCEMCNRQVLTVLTVDVNAVFPDENDINVNKHIGKPAILSTGFHAKRLRIVTG